MSVEQCLAEIERAVGRELSDSEQDHLEREVANMVRRLRETDIDDMDAGLARALEDRANEIEVLAWVEKRNQLLNMRARARMLDYATSQWSDDLGVGLRAYLGGVASTRQGSRNSVAWAQETLTNNYVAGFLTELESANLLGALRTGAFDRDVYRAIYARARGDAETEAAVPREAKQIADIVRRYQNKIRKDANDAGAWIGELDDYVARQVHDPYRIRQASENDWIAFMESRIDWQRSFPDVTDASERQRILRRAYSDFASGVHEAQPQEGPSTNLRGFANIGRRMSQERVFHFKDADSAFEYMQEFGRGRLSDTLVNQFEITAQNTALMRMMGPNAENNFQLVADQLRRQLRDADAATRARFERIVDGGPQSLQRTLIPNLTGESRRPGVHAFAKRSMETRQLLQMAKLGGATISAITDLPFYASEVAYQGGGFLQGMAEAVGGLARGTTPEQRRVLSQMGVIMDGMRGTVLSRFDVSDNVPGKFTRLTNLYFKANLLQPWTDRLRGNFALARGHDMYNQRGMAFDQLKAEERRALELYGIDTGKWDLYRQQSGMSDGQRTYFTPEGMDDVPEEAIATYLQAQNRSVSNRAIRETRDQVKQEFRSYFGDRASFAALTPDTRTRSILLQGTQPGTVTGELARHVALFKSFPTTVMLKPLARERHGRGNLRGQGARFNDSPMMGLATLVAWNTAFGYMAMNIKEMLRGRTPRVPEEPGAFRDVFFASMVQGGGLGIYGDFLFGETKNRYGQTFVASLMGPTAGSVDDLADLYGRAVSGDDTAANGIRFITNHTPGNNLFYTRMALDYLVLNRVQEWANPGSLRRTERRMEREMGNEYWLRPSEQVPYGGF